MEEPRTGPTSRFCAELAARLHCHVVAGYPERLPPHEVEHAELSDGRAIKRVGANAAALYGPDGKFVGEYRKTNLYDTDMTWAKPGKLYHCQRSVVFRGNKVEGQSIGCHGSRARRPHTP